MILDIATITIKNAELIIVANLIFLLTIVNIAKNIKYGYKKPVVAECPDGKLDHLS
jgi:hypothetical protein